MTRAHVPKAAVYEYRNSLSREYKVWPTEHVDMSSPSHESTATEQRCQAKLCRRVSPTLDLRHYLRALLSRKDVGHGYLLEGSAIYETTPRTIRAICFAKSGGTAFPT